MIEAFIRNDTVSDDTRTVGGTSEHQLLINYLIYFLREHYGNKEVIFNAYVHSSYHRR